MPSKEMQRLSTYAQWPMPSDACSGISNFVFKAAGAHFERTADCLKDEVICQSCGLLFSGWSTDVPPFKCNLRESPAAVHRVISPRCPALNPLDSDEGATTRAESFTEMQAYRSSLMESMFAGSSVQSSHIQTTGSMTPEQSPRPTNVQRATRVQRVLFPESHEHDQQDADEDHQNTVSEVRQSDSMSNPVPHSSVLHQTPITHPFKPKSGNYDHLLASHRLQTFPQPVSNTKFQTWADEGFIYRREQQDVMCVYCGTVLVLNGHQPGVVHRNTSPTCPFVMGFDVGNISQNLEKCVRLVYFKQQAATKFSDSEVRIKCVQFQKEEDRLGSFQGWPKMCAKIFPASAMASAGFFYSGCSDKVKCYSCGVELFDWSEDADVWKTHATVSPTCLHVINCKGQDFIAQAANLQVLAEVKHPNEMNAAGNITSSDGVWGEEPGSPILDMTAVKAALACGYTVQQIEHAIVKFFCQTSRYPNEAILKASLKAADENHITICQQQQVVLEQGTQLQQTFTQLQQKDTQLQQTFTQLQQKDTQLEQKDTQLEQKDTQLEQKDTHLQRVIEEKEQLNESHQQQLSEKEEQLSEKEEQLSEKEEQLREKEDQLRLQDQQIQSLMQQVQRLRADHQHRAVLAPGPQGDGALNARNEENNHQPLVCKICMSDRPRMIFLPCGHIFSCAECTSRLPDQRCPVCRQDISEVLPAFVA